MAIVDQSVSQAVAAAKRAGGMLSYSAVQNIIRSVFDFGQITVIERDDLREVLKTMPMDDRSRRTLTSFLNHVDKASVLADAIAKRTGNKNQGIKVSVPDPGPFSKLNTDLGKFSHGNFDVLYMPVEGELWVILKVKYSFRKGSSAGDQNVIRWRLAKAVQAWDNANATLETTEFVLNPVIRIRFILREVTTDAHKTVDVHTDADYREWIGMEINVKTTSTVHTLTHELGHVFGNYDEYRGSGIKGWIERRMYWHDNRYLSDTTALMQDGNDFRARYFDHFRDFVNRHFSRIPAKYRIQI